MAGNRKPRQGRHPQRIEPSFDNGGYSVGQTLRAVGTDRVGSNGSRPASGKSASANTHSAKRKAGRKSPQKNRRKASGSGGFFRFLKRGFYWSFVLGIWAGIAVVGIITWYGLQLPSSSTWKIPDRPPNVRIVSVDGTLMANRGITGGAEMGLDEMSPYIPMAVIAIEDRRFKSHFGVDPLGIARAMVTNIVSGRLVQGGSTLTQQLAKNLFLEPRRDLGRKVQEAILSLWLEHKFSKDEILELYLNRVYFGSGAYGVDAASRRYFSKSARDVNLAEAALLAGLLKAPSALSPARNPKGAEERAQVVLGAMRRAGFVTDREVATALTMEAKKAKRYWSGSEHYAADLVMKELKNVVGELKTDVRIDTTIDLDLQKLGGKLIRDTLLKNGKKLNVSQGALVSLDGTGAIRAIVGGADYADSQYNRATDARRQPGSAFKPIVYLAALEQGLNPDTVRVDRPVKIGNWRPENYDKKYRGPVTLSEALSNSLNTIAAQLVSETGTGEVIKAAEKLGIKSKLERNASIALGTSEVTLLELTSAYAVFANGGYLAEPFIIKRVTTLDGQILFERNGTNAPQVVQSREVGMMNDMLRRTVEEGTGKAARFENWQAAGKTGTTQNFRDALFVGYSANLVTGVWYGNDDGEPTKKVTGGNLPARTFAGFMAKAHKGVPVADLPGFYLPQTVAVIPSPNPRSSAAQVSGDRLQPFAEGQPIAQNGGQVRQPLSTITTGSPRPSGEVGVANRQDRGQREKPRNILDILFGR